MNDQPVDINDVLNNSFFLSLIDAQHKAIINITTRNGFIIGQNNYHLLSSYEKKLTRTFQLTNDLIEIINDIKTVYVLINRRLPKKYLDKHNISELDYIKFHFEVFLHKVYTVCEIMKLIANEVLNINLPLKDCTWDKLVKFSDFNNSTCKTIIQQYFRDFQNLIEDRHLNTHRGIYDDKEMNDVNIGYSIYRSYNKLNFPVDDEFQQMIPYPIVKMRVQCFKKNKLKALLTFEQQILKHVKSFFQSLVWTE